MGKRGPKAKEQAIGILPNGLSEKRPGPRKGMTLRAQRIWKEIVSSLPPTHFRPGDLPILRAYCEAEALHFIACKKIAEEGGVIDRLALTKDGDVVVIGVKANPWVAIMVSQTGVKSQLGTKLRLFANTRITPQAAGKEKQFTKSKRKGMMFGEGK
jgi:hypothetical protein